MSEDTPTVLVTDGNCPACAGLGWRFAPAVANADRSSFTFTVGRCECVRVVRVPYESSIVLHKAAP